MDIIWATRQVAPREFILYYCTMNHFLSCYSSLKVIPYCQDPHSSPKVFKYDTVVCTNLYWTSTWPLFHVLLCSRTHVVTVTYTIHLSSLQKAAVLKFGGFKHPYLARRVSNRKYEHLFGFCRLFLSILHSICLFLRSLTDSTLHVLVVVKSHSNSQLRVVSEKRILVRLQKGPKRGNRDSDIEFLNCITSTSSVSIWLTYFTRTVCTSTYDTVISVKLLLEPSVTIQKDQVKPVHIRNCLANLFQQFRVK